MKQTKMCGGYYDAAAYEFQVASRQHMMRFQSHDQTLDWMRLAGLNGSPTLAQGQTLPTCCEAATHGTCQKDPKFNRLMLVSLPVRVASACGNAFSVFQKAWKMMEDFVESPRLASGRTRHRRHLCCRSSKWDCWYNSDRSEVKDNSIR